MNYATKKELDQATGVDPSDLAAEKGFIPLKAEVNNLDINNDAVNNEVVKNTKFQHTRDKSK